MSKRVHHFYVFTYRDGSAIPTYERTCPDARTAMARLRTTGRDGFVTHDYLPERYWY